MLVRQHVRPKALGIQRKLFQKRRGNGMIGTHYRIIKQFEGGMGIAFLCEDIREPGKKAILKTHKGGGDEATLRAAFTREAQIWISLNRHQYLARVTDVLSLEGRIFIEMEYYESGNLRALLCQGQLSVEKAIALGAQIVLGMAYFSDDQKLLHLDLKPENILIGNYGEALVTDLGLARALQPTLGLDSIAGEAGVASDPILAGTLPYMAPEMFAGRQIDARADIWAWGLIVFEMIMGRRAYESVEWKLLVQAIVNDKPMQWRQFKAQVPSALFTIVARCLSKKPADRYKTFGELAAALDTVLALGSPDKPDHFAGVERIHVPDAMLCSHWITSIRPRHELKSRFKYTEIMLLTQATRLRTIGDTPGAVAALMKLFRPEPGWGKRWIALMQQREDEIIARRSEPGINYIILGRAPLRYAAELYLMCALDMIYEGARIPIEILEDHLEACVAIWKSDHKSPKLAQLLGQFYLEKGFHDDAEDAFIWAWRNANSNTRAPTAVCLLTLHKRRNRLDAIRRFTTTELVPTLRHFDDAGAQEACGRAYVYLGESSRALPYLRRALAFDERRPWALMQACIAAWNTDELQEARRWRGRLIELMPDSPFMATLDKTLPALSES